ncbi:hypothetical protein [Spirosoma agri]|uniref:Uncharacterized protein n=1 Tax=Spirosoma agri TaxID=1987381 RepID=A0A6M0IRF7_9BACT|nr:hypothetical protein [Spirosoma agri]NEU70664.1 hypothetical protein [Spirosoma agri]
MNASHSIDPIKDLTANSANKNTSTFCASHIHLVATSSNKPTEFDCLIAQYKAKVFEQIAYLYKP